MLLVWSWCAISLLFFVSIGFILRHDFARIRVELRLNPHRPAQPRLLIVSSLEENKITNIRLLVPPMHHIPSCSPCARIFAACSWRWPNYDAPGFRKYVRQPYLMITTLRQPLELFVSAQQFQHRDKTRTLEEAIEWVSEAMADRMRYAPPG